MSSGTVSPKRQNRYALFACGGRGGTSMITLKISGATKCGAVALYRDLTVLHIYISLFTTIPTLRHFACSGPRHLVRKAILIHTQLAIFVWNSGRWKLKILIRQGRSVNWRPSHSLSKHKIMFTRHLYPCSVPQLNILQFQYEIRGNKSHRWRSWR